MKSHNFRRWSRIGTAAAASGAIALLAGCSAATTSLAASSSAGGSATSAPPTAESGSISAAPSSLAPDPNDVATMPAEKSGGSSAQLKGPCDGGTLTVKAYPDGKGVALTATLRKVAHASWGIVTLIPPYVDPGEDPRATLYTAHNGTLVVHANNLTGPTAIAGGRHAWPEGVEVDLNPTRKNPVFCGQNGVLLDAAEAVANTENLQVEVERRTGVLRLHDAYVASGGAWKVALTVRSPSGVRHLTQSVTAHAIGDGAIGHNLSTRMTGLHDLRDFAAVIVTVSRNGKPGTWMVLSRTP